MHSHPCKPLSFYPPSASLIIPVISGGIPHILFIHLLYATCQFHHSLSFSAQSLIFPRLSGILSPLFMFSKKSELLYLRG